MVSINIDSLGGYLARGGGLYRGEFQNGKPHGKGQITQTTGNKYEGDW